MKNILSVMLCSVLFVSLIANGSLSADENRLTAALKSLIDTERDFSKTSAEKGIQQSFLQFLADDAVLFRPSPVEGKKFLLTHSSSDGWLSWEPQIADVAFSGDFGYTIGPWEYRKGSPTDTNVAYGTFVTIWKKQADSSWKVAIDIGISNPEPGLKHPGFHAAPEFSTTLPDTSKKLNLGIQLKSLSNAENDLASKSRQEGAAAAYTVYAADSLRFIRDGVYPVVGKTGVVSILSTRAGTLDFQSAKSEIARSADLGYTYGTSQFKRGTSGSGLTEYASYLHIWRKVGERTWRMVVDIEIPTPAPKEK